MLSGRSPEGGARRLACALAVVVAFVQVPGVAAADWWEENFELHGYLQSTSYWQSPSLSFGKAFQQSSWENQLNLEFNMRLFETDNSKLSFAGVVRPTYNAVYDTYPNLYGDRRTGGKLGSQNALYSKQAMRGSSFPGHGAGIEGQQYDANQDTAFYFTGSMNPQLVYDNTIFFGMLGGPSRPRGEAQPKVGGQSNLIAFRHMRNLLSSFGLDATTSELIATWDAGLASGGLVAGLTAPSGLNLGRRRSLEGGQYIADVNATEGQLQTDCFDNAHPECWAREFYFDFEWRDTFVRVGKQQIVWGKTDAFRLQDIVNPMDLGLHSIFPNLEDRRIPTLALDVIQSFGDVGPFQDVSAEFVWVFDRFSPVQLGQCGEPYSFEAACELRADVNGHALLNTSVAAVDERQWTWKNTEPGVRFEFRLPDPAIAFSLSAFWGFQDAPLVKFTNHYSTTNPNPAVMMFNQSLFELQGASAGISDPLMANGFDPFDYASIQRASDAALAGWGFLFGSGGVACDSDVLSGQDHANCIAASGAQSLGWIWSTSEAVLEYPRTLTLGGSLDYQIPGIDTVLRLELAYDIDRQVTNTNKFDGTDSSDFLLAAIGLDRSWFIPWLNKSRTAFMSFQTFVEHCMSYDGSQRRGMPFYENSVITTGFMQNYWRNDSIVLTNFVAIDWPAQAWAIGPNLKYILNDTWSFEVGTNVIWGRSKEHNIRDICPDGSLNCLGDPTTWNEGNWQLINEDFRRYAKAPYTGLMSFGDTISEDRDEVYFRVTYQF